MNIFQVQQCIEFLVDEALRMGAHPDDRDSVTDMTFLMFTCKAGAAGVGDGTMAAKVLRFGIEMGSSKNMYFPIIQLILWFYNELIRCQHES